MPKDDNKCSFPKCRSDDITLNWLGINLCAKHWDWVCEHGNKEALIKLGRTDLLPKEKT